MKAKLQLCIFYLSTFFGLFLATVACLGAGTNSVVRRDAPEKIRGAVYVASDAFNAPQMWKNFSVEETCRDFGYAKAIHLNALRIWASYEYWKMEPTRFKTSFDQMLNLAQTNGIRILISLFESDGKPPTPENMWTTDPALAVAIRSPGPDIASPDHPDRWDGPRGFVKWFMEYYRNDPRLLAIELMNEPRGKAIPFAQAMFIAARSMQGSVPLTMGTDSLKSARQYIPLGLDIIEYHDNFPTTLQGFEKGIQAALALGQKYDLPVWLTEWQRLRPGGSGWGKSPVAKEETYPDFASLAATVHKYPVGNFFWSLMVKRAYLESQRAKGTISGVFWPDGSIWSLADARAVAQDPTLKWTERKSLPAGYLDYLTPRK